MPVLITHHEVAQPTKAVELWDQYGYRGVQIRPVSTGQTSMRTIVLVPRLGSSEKFAVTLGDLRTFGQALIDIADGK